MKKFGLALTFIISIMGYQQTASSGDFPKKGYSETGSSADFSTSNAAIPFSGVLGVCINIDPIYPCHRMENTEPELLSTTAYCNNQARTQLQNAMNLIIESNQCTITPLSDIYDASYDPEAAHDLTNYVSTNPIDPSDDISANMWNRVTCRRKPLSSVENRVVPLASKNPSDMELVSLGISECDPNDFNTGFIDQRKATFGKSSFMIRMRNFSPRPQFDELITPRP